MENEALKIRVKELLPAANFLEGGDPGAGQWPTVLVATEQWHLLAEQLRNIDDLLFDYLFCLTCIDWKTHLTMVYHLTSTRYRHTLVVKSNLDRNIPEIKTVSNIWRTADFHEREVYEMFGVRFGDHPDLRLLILPDGWEGKNPLRKDFEDPINMIKL